MATTTKRLFCLVIHTVAAVLISSEDLSDLDLENVAQDFLNLPEEDAARLSRHYTGNEARNQLLTLRYVLVVTRHGSRSPTETYPNDPYPFTDLKYWPDGPGQLTRLGKQQLYATGRILRHRYHGFININYYPNDTEVRSNPFDRDYMSAACLLAGLYPPTGYQIWSKKIAWQPIPIWEDRYDIAEIATKPNICPIFSQLQAKTIDRLNEQSSQYSDLFKYLSDNTGVKISNISQIPLVWDTLQIQKENGYKLPRWAKKVFPKKLAYLEGIAFQAAVYGTGDQLKLVVGPLLEMILDQLNTKARGQMHPNRKLYINAAHDITLRALLDGIGLHGTFPIDTSAFMIFELHEDSVGHSVQVLYFNSSSSRHPHNLNIPECNGQCSLANFNAVLQKNIPNNWRAECGLTSSSTTTEENTTDSR